MNLLVTIEPETDGRWLAIIPALPGVMVYGATPAEARAAVHALARDVIADRREHGEMIPNCGDCDAYLHGGD